VEGQTVGAVAATTNLGHAHARTSLAGMEMMHVVRATGDSIAAGLPPMTIAVEQLGRVSEALSFAAATSDKTTGALGFLSKALTGFSGIAIMGVITVLGILLTKMDLFNDKLGEEEKKLHDAAHASDIAAEAHKHYDLTLDGLIEKEKKLNDELEREIKNKREIAQGNADTQAQNADYLKGQRDNKKLALDQAEKTLKQLEANPMPVEGRSAVAHYAEIAGAKSAVKAARTAYEDANSAAMKAEVDARKQLIPVLQNAAREKNDPSLAQKNRLEDEQSKLTSQLGLGTITPKEYESKWGVLQNKIDAIKDDKSATPAQENALGKMVQLLQSMGMIVTSTNQGKHVKNSDHYVDRAIDFVPKAGMSAFTKEEMRQKLIEAGVNIRVNEGGTEQFFDARVDPQEKGHRPHFHVAWNGTPSAESAQRKAEARQRKADESANAFTNLGESLDSQIEGAKIDRKGNDPVEIYKETLAKIKADDAKMASKIAEEAKKHGWTKEQVAALTGKEGELDTAKITKAQEDERQAIATKRLAKERDDYDTAVTILGIQSTLATTLAERRQIAFDLLALEHDQKKKEIEADSSLKPDEMASKLSNLDKTYDYQKKKTADDTVGPYQKYKDQLHNNTDDMNAAFEGVKAHGLQSLEDGLVGLITGTESVASAFKKMAASIIADIARIAVEKLILSVIGLKDGGSVGGGALHLAGGGPVFGSGGSREDRVPAMLSAGEFVVNAAATGQNRRLLEAINNGDHIRVAHYANGGFVDSSKIYYPSIPNNMAQRQASQGPIIYDLRGAVMTEQLLAQMNQISQRYAMASLIGASEMAKGDLGGEARRTLR
jgi:hypothetical protein